MTPHRPGDLGFSVERLCGCKRVGSEKGLHLRQSPCVRVCVCARVRVPVLRVAHAGDGGPGPQV